jgi:hypothetical protein
MKGKKPLGVATDHLLMMLDTKWKKIVALHQPKHYTTLHYTQTQISNIVPPEFHLNIQIKIQLHITEQGIR